MQILRELADLHCRYRQRARHLQGAIDRRQMIRVVGVLKQAIKAEQHGEALAIQRKTRRRQRRCAQRIHVDACIRLAQPLRFTRQCCAQCVQVMREGGRLRLHAVGISGDDGFDMQRRQRQRLFTREVQRTDFLQQAITQIHARHRRGEILPTAPTVQARSVRAHHGGQTRFVIKVIGRTARHTRGLHLFDDCLDAGGDARRRGARHDAHFGQHDDTRLVDLIEKRRRASAAAEGFVDIERATVFGGRFCGFGHDLIL